MGGTSANKIPRVLIQEALTTPLKGRWASAARLSSQPILCISMQDLIKNTGGYASWATECGKLFIYERQSYLGQKMRKI